MIKVLIEDTAIGVSTCLRVMSDVTGHWQLILYFTDVRPQGDHWTLNTSSGEQILAFYATN